MRLMKGEAWFENKPNFSKNVSKAYPCARMKVTKDTPRFGIDPRGDTPFELFPP